MSPNIVVFPDADSLTPAITDDIGAYSDLAGSRPPAKSPIVAGIWELRDRETSTQAYTAEWDEMKYIIRGTAVITNHATGATQVLKPGSLLWIPKGSKASFSQSKDFATIYVEQRHGEGPFKTGSEGSDKAE